MNYIYLIITVVAIILASLAGVFFANKKFINFFDKHNQRFVAFSTGVFLMMVLSVLHEIWDHANDYVMMSLIILAGFVFAVLINYFFPETHQHHDNKCEHKKNKQLARRVVIGDAIHNMSDGIILVPAFVVSPFVGLMTGFSILVHELLQEISEFFVLKKAGYSTYKALLQNLLASLTIILGVAIGFLFRDNEFIMLFLLAFSSGMFIYLIVSDLLPEIHNKKDKKQTLINVVLLGLGFALLMIIGSLAPHSHDHDNNEGKNQDDTHIHDHKH